MRHKRSILLIFLIFYIILPIEPRRRVSQAEKAFEDIEGVDWDSEGPETSSPNAPVQEEKKDDESKPEEKSIKTKSQEGEQSIEVVKTTTEKVTTTTDREHLDEEEKKIKQLLEGTMDLYNMTKMVEEEYAESKDSTHNRTIFWLDAHYKALDYDLNVTAYPECRAWRKYWAMQKTNETEIKSNETTTTEAASEEKTVEDFSDMSEEEMEKLRRETEIVDSKKRLKELGMNPELLKIHKAIGFVFKEICGDYGRVMWFKTRDESVIIGITNQSAICDPYKVELNPAAGRLKELETKLNEMIANITGGLSPTPKRTTTRTPPTESSRYITEYPPSFTKEDEAKILAKQNATPTAGVNETVISLNENIGLPTSATISTSTSTTTLQPQPTTLDSSWPQLSTAPPLEDFDDDETLYEYVDENGKKLPTTRRPVVHIQVQPPATLTDSNETTIDNSTSTLLEEITEVQLTDEQKEAERKRQLKENAIMHYDDDVYDYVDMFYRFKVKTGVWKENKKRKTKHSHLHDRKKRSAEEDVKEKLSDRGEDEGIEDWLHQAKHGALTEKQANEADEIKQEEEKEKNATTESKWVVIDGIETLNPSLLISNMEAIEALGLNIQEEAFVRYQKVGLHLPGICSTFTPAKVDEFKSEGFDSDLDDIGPIGVNLTALEEAGVDLDALAKKLRNDTEVDDILQRTANSTKHHGGSYILPVLSKNKYDPFSAPIVFQGSAVVVRFGIYIESMSNFQTTTMDYDMDIYLMMSWRDARLVNRYDQPILVKEEEILEKIWRPDPFFANAKEAEYHEVTFLNFLMRIYSDGLVLYETRVKITPSCNLILCKYPHDKQTCDLLIKSFAYPVETVRFEWFTRRKDAIDKNPDVKLPELYIDRYEPTICPTTRKSGEFSCLRAVFRLKRDVGYHIAQTYIPTSLALMFSWVGVWLPEEFMEGRIGVAITVLLTLSTESAGAREHLPSVSYLKAIDLWFGFITGFVFFTLLQTLFVIGFDKRASQLKKWATKKKSDLTEELREALLEKAKRYHKTGRYLDNFCRVFYPLSFVLFLIMYYFVFTEGRQDDCMNRR